MTEDESDFDGGLFMQVFDILQSGATVSADGAETYNIDEIEEAMFMVVSWFTAMRSDLETKRDIRIWSEHAAKKLALLVRSARKEHDSSGLSGIITTWERKGPVQ